jgi:hypothetical protein
MTPEQAQQLSVDVVTRLAKWQSLKAALKSGGPEIKATITIVAR